MIITEKRLRSIIREAMLSESITRSSLESAVDNAIKKLELESVSNLREFMLEIANAESGHNPHGLSQITHYNSNPFQMTNVAIKATSVWGDGTEQEATAAMRDAFNRNSNAINTWSDQDYAEIKSNLKMSTIAAAMYIMFELDGQSIGSNVEERARQWESIYNKEAGEIGGEEERAEKKESQIQMYIRKNS